MKNKSSNIIVSDRENHKKKTIIIIGGGAAGLELAARLSKNYFKKRINLLLVDNKLSHIWKPLLHEVASGTLHSWDDEIDYISYASRKGFKFFYGSIEKIDRNNKTITLSKIIDEHDQIILPERKLFYDFLIFSIGSLINDFNIPGVNQFCLFLDNLTQAAQFNKILLQHILKYVQSSEKENRINIAIIGGGATGIELAAELHYALSQIYYYANKEEKIPKYFQITIVESSSRILSNLPEKISLLVKNHLTKMGINILTQTYVTEVNEKGIKTNHDSFYPADLKIWAAGIKADRLLKSLDNLETNKINQLMVKQNLQTTKDPFIFAIGDCASCPQYDHTGNLFFTPPRAQVAHQQAKLLAKSIQNHLNGKPFLNYFYKDYGSLLTISKYNTVGVLMVRIARKIYIQGMFARFSYWSLYKIHQVTLWGIWHVILSTLANLLAQKLHARLKLH